MTWVHLADAPLLLGRRVRELKTLIDASVADGIKVVDDDRIPDALV
jgi:hypothetical protein